MSGMEIYDPPTRWRDVVLGVVYIGTVLAGIGVGFYAGLAQRLDELDGPMHDCAPCELEHYLAEDEDVGPLVHRARRGVVR